MDIKLIEEIINKSIKKLIAEYELTNTTFLHVLHQNIDILTSNTENWFNKNIPEEFTNVIKSLMTLSLLYYKEKSDYSKSIVEPQYEEIDPLDLLSNIVVDIKSLVGIEHIKIINTTESCKIKTAKIILRESLYNILLSLSQFMDHDSECCIAISEDQSNVKINLEFKEMTDNVPDISKLSRIFFSYFDGEKYHISIGINVAIENLRNIGVIVKIKNFGNKNTINIALSFPSTVFLQTIEEIRKERNEIKIEKDEEVIINISDIIIEMVLREILFDKGYTIKKADLHDTGNSDQLCKCSAMIVDCESIITNFNELPEFIERFKVVKKIIIIYGSDDNIDTSIENNNITFLKKPFELDALVRYIS